MDKKTIIIAEDQTIVREGIRSLIDSTDEYEVVAEAANGLDAIRGVSNYSPDLIILDIAMPKMNGIAAIKEIKRQHPDTKILALTLHQSEEYIREAFQSGANGYCLKTATYEELMMAIKTVLSGENYMSPKVTGTVLEGYLKKDQAAVHDPLWNTVTQREKEILKLVGEGYKSQEIAEMLFISAKTVDKHRSNLMKKLNLHNAAALTAYAIEKGLVSK